MAEAGRSRKVCNPADPSWRGGLGPHRAGGQKSGVKVAPYFAAQSQPAPREPSHRRSVDPID